MTHGLRPHMARQVACPVKVGFTTYSAAASLLSRVPGAERVIRGSCCGMYHITSMTETEFAQMIARQGCTDGYNRGMMDLSTEEYLKRWDATHAYTDTPTDQDGREPEAGARDAGEASQSCGRPSRLAPSPTALARRFQARGHQGW